MKKENKLEELFVGDKEVVIMKIKQDLFDHEKRLKKMEVVGKEKDDLKKIDILIYEWCKASAGKQTYEDFFLKVEKIFEKRVGKMWIGDKLYREESWSKNQAKN